MKRSRAALVALLVAASFPALAGGAPWPAPVPGHVPVAPGEHPRLILRRSDIASLRERAKTPMGQGVIERVKRSMRLRTANRENVKDLGYRMAGHGALYVLTGDEKRAATARRELTSKFAALQFERLLTTLEQSNRLMGVALAYDLCYDAWDDAARAKMSGYIESRARDLLEGSRKGKRPPWDSMRALVYSSVGTSALALLGDPGASPETQKTLDECEAEIRRYITLAMSPGGNCVEGEGLKHMAFASGVFPFLYAYRNVTGKDLTATPNVRRFLPALVMTTVPGMGTPQFGRAGTAKDRSGVFAMGFGVTPEEYRPAVLWLYEQVVGEKHYDVTRPHHGLYMLLGYPYGVEAANPSEAFPLALADEERGVYVFRNRWRDADDFVAVVDFARPPRGAKRPVHEPGALRIWGLGGKWAGRPGIHAHLPWARTETSKMENAAGFVGGSHAVSGLSSVETRHFDARPDGSGAVTVAYEGVVKRTRAKMRKEVRVDGRKRKIEVEVPKGGPFRALRSFAADYSGASGAPGLFVVADRLEGGGGAAAAWVMHTQCLTEARGKVAGLKDQIAELGSRIAKAKRDRKLAEDERKAEVTRCEAKVKELKGEVGRVWGEYIRVRGNTFTLKGPGGASVRGTFVAPEGAPEGARVVPSMNYPYWGFVRVEGPREYLVVMTVQKGDPPEVRVEGSGLGAKITVGRRTARFDGEKIVLGE